MPTTTTTTTTGTTTRVAGFRTDVAYAWVGCILFAAASFAYWALLQLAKFRKASDKMAIAIKYLQNVLLLITFDLPWPEVFLDLYAYFDWLNFDFLGIVPLACLPAGRGVKMTVAMKLAMPLVMGAVFLFYYRYVLFALNYLPSLTRSSTTASAPCASAL